MSKYKTLFRSSFIFVLALLGVISYNFSTISGLGINTDQHGSNNWFEIIVEKHMADKDDDFRSIFLSYFMNLF